MIVYQPWYDNGMSYDQHYQYPSGSVYVDYEDAEFEILEEGYAYQGEVGGRDIGEEDAKIYSDFYETRAYAVIVKIKLIGEIK